MRSTVTLTIEHERPIPADRLRTWATRSNGYAVSLHRPERAPGEVGAEESGWEYVTIVDVAVAGAES